MTQDRQPAPFHALQPAIWPEVGISTETAPYLGLTGPCATSLDHGGVIFAPGGAVMVDG